MAFSDLVTTMSKTFHSNYKEKDSFDLDEKEALKSIWMIYDNYRNKVFL